MYRKLLYAFIFAKICTLIYNGRDVQYNISNHYFPFIPYANKLY
jgi:hypothetical protein